MSSIWKLDWLKFQHLPNPKSYKAVSWCGDVTTSNWTEFSQVRLKDPTWRLDGAMTAKHHGDNFDHGWWKGGKTSCVEMDNIFSFFGNRENEALIAYPWRRKQLKLEVGYTTDYSWCLYFFAIFAAVLQWLQWIFCPLPGSSHSSMSPLRKRHSQQYPESLRKPTHECFWTNWQSHRRQKLPNCKQHQWKSMKIITKPRLSSGLQGGVVWRQSHSAWRSCGCVCKYGLRMHCAIHQKQPKRWTACAR